MLLHERLCHMPIFGWESILWAADTTWHRAAPTRRIY